MKKLVLIGITIILSLGACQFAQPNQATPTEPVMPSGMERYQGQGMSIMLPASFVERNVQDDLPSIVDIIKRFTGGDDGLLSTLLENVNQNVAWWGWDSETLEENPLRLLVIKNKALHALPLTTTAFGLERILNNEETKVEQATVHLGGRSVLRFKYSKDDIAWVAYAFKEQGYLWVNLFMFTPEGMIGASDFFEDSIGTIKIDVVENDAE